MLAAEIPTEWNERPAGCKSYVMINLIFQFKEFSRHAKANITIHTLYNYETRFNYSRRHAGKSACVGD
jgi:hypothetical protein